MSLLALFFLVSRSLAVWTEADESRRIAQLKQEETRAFEMQMKGQNPFVGGGGSSNGYYGNYYGSNGAHGNSEMYGSYQSGMAAAYQNGHYGNYPDRLEGSHDSPVHRVPIESRRSHASELKSPSSTQVKRIVEVKTKTWCFHCASLWNSINSDMQQAMRNLLEIRRARFPSTSYVRADCSNPKNVSDLPKQMCSIGYCQTLVLTDHDSASSLTIRGCAERLGAIDERELERRGDNTCKRLHQTVDIQECICKNRKFCYSGSSRNYGYREDEEADIYKCTQSFTSPLRMSLAILVIAGLRILSTFI